MKLKFLLLGSFAIIISLIALIAGSAVLYSRAISQSLGVSSFVPTLLLIAGIIVLSLAIFIGYYASIVITKPLSQLSKSNRLIIEGKFEEAQQVPFPHDLPSELQELIQTREKALAELVGKQKIEETNKKLQQATKDLEERNKFDKKKRVATLSILEDVDEQKKLVEQSEEKLKTTLHSIGDAVISTDTKSNVTFMNPVAENLTGWKLQEAKGKPLLGVFNIINEKTKKPVPNPVTKVLKEGVTVGLANHTVLISRTGKKVPIDDSGAPIRDKLKNITGAVLVFHDVTEERKKQNVILQANKDLTSMTEQLKIQSLFPLMNPGPSIQLNNVGVVLSSNPASEKIFGKLMGKSFFNISGVDSSLVKRIFKKEKNYQTEVHRHGKKYQLTFKKDPLTDLIFVYGADVTQIKTVENELREAYYKLQELDQLKNEFLGMTSHELKTPITPIRMQANLLLNETIGKMNSEQKKSVEMILRNVNNLNNLLSDVLDTAKLEAGKLKLFKEKVNLNELIMESIDDVKIDAGSGNIFLESKLATLPPIMLDPRRIKQVLLNLLRNAIKFTPPDGKIIVLSGINKDYVEIKVQDNGKGIEKTMLKKIFEKFAQVKPSYEIYEKGTGLGLTVSKGIIDQHLGKIWVESEGLGKGSVFIFTLPLNKKKKYSRKSK